MQVSLDSPEAFEEVLWLAYLRDRIVAERTLQPLSRLVPSTAGDREQPQVLACMHGSAWHGDGASLLRALARSLAGPATMAADAAIDLAA